MKSPRRHLALFSLLVLLSSGKAAAAPLLQSLCLGIAAGPLLGLDRALRGGALSLDAGLSPAALFKDESGDRLVLGGRAELSYDSCLEAWQADCALYLALGPDLRLELGGLVPLSPASIEGSPGRERIGLGPRLFPSSFVAAATIAELAPARPAAGKGARFFERPRVVLEARLGWTAYEARGLEGEEADPALTGEAGFAAGLVAGLFVALRWGR
jgi:hypothetical protein